MSKNMFKFCLIFVLFSIVFASPFDDGIFYFIGSDCSFKSAITFAAHINTIESYQQNAEGSCQNIASAVFQSFKGNHLIVIKYEAPKEISIFIQQMENKASTINLSFKKVNYEYMLGDYCNFDKTLLSIGIDSNLAYITVKCGEELWAFMRSVLTASGDFYTPSGPLIYFKKGNPSFDRLLFLTSSNGPSQRDSVVVRYYFNEDENVEYLQTYLHELNKTDSSPVLSSLSTTKRSIFSTSLGIVASVEKIEGLEKTEVIIFNFTKSALTQPKLHMKLQSKDYTFIRAWGFYPKFVEEKEGIITWKIRDTERAEIVESEDCSLWRNDEKKNCIEKSTAEDDFEKNGESSTHWFFYLIAGIEFIIFLAALSTLIALIVLKRKKKKSKIVSKRDGPAVTQVATVVSTVVDDVSNTTNTNNV